MIGNAGRKRRCSGLIGPGTVLHPRRADQLCSKILSGFDLGTTVVDKLAGIRDPGQAEWTRSRHGLDNESNTLRRETMGPTAFQAVIGRLCCRRDHLPPAATGTDTGDRSASPPR
jgi:hypothetical protein